MNRSAEPLTPEERALAERLARLNVRREPAPALDAAILASARAAVDGGSAPATLTATSARTAAPAPSSSDTGTSAQSTTPSSTVVPMPARKPMPRWPLGLSLAASLVLAAGIGWRLADGSGSDSAMDSAAERAQSEPAVYAADAAAAVEEPTQAVILEPELNRVPPPPPPPPLEAQAERRVAAVESPRFEEQKAKRLDDAKDGYEAFEMDEGVAHDAIADSAPVVGNTSAFPAEPPARSNASSETAGAAAKPAAVGGGVSDGLVGGARDKGETAKSDREGELEKAQAVRARATRQVPAAAPAAPPPPAAATVADQPFDEQPPVTADSPQFRQAWLQRIRDLFAKGQADAGRNSLQEFRRRYPDAELPEDLKKIAATLPPPTP
jgi:hypothetical protein